MPRYLTGRAVTLAHTFLNDEDALTPETVSVTVTRAGASVPAVQGEAVRAGTVYTFPAGMLPEGQYAVKWDGSTAVDVETIEVVGGYLFSIPEARASDEDLTADRFPAPEVRHYRDVVESEFERITGRSFTPRTRFLERSKVPGPTDLLPVADIRSVAIVGGLSAGPATIERVGDFGYLTSCPEDASGIEIAYGFTAAPEGIARVGKLYLRYLLTAERSGIPDRATSYQPVDGGTYTLATAGRGGSETGIPDVDAVLKDYDFEIINSVAL